MRTVTLALMVCAALACPPMLAAASAAGDTAGRTSRPQRFSMEFRDADLRDVFRLLGQESGQNIVVGKGVAGKITLSFQEVTLEEALDAILRGFGYHFQREGNMVLITAEAPPAAAPAPVTRIVTLRHAQDAVVLESIVAQLKPLLSGAPGAGIVSDINGRYIGISDVPENVERIAKLAESLDSASPIVVREVPVPYLYGESDLQRLVEGLKTKLSGIPGADVSYYVGTNSIVVSDTEEHVERIRAFVAGLGRETPQVRIEARIVEVKDIFQAELGVQWGSRYSADPAHGNALPFAFPNSINISGGSGKDSAYMVNLPAAAAPAGIGLSFGHVANILSLDVKLSALERMDKLKILSSPTILAMQGKEAVIKVGEQIPYLNLTTEASGSTRSDVNFKDIVLQLRVVPSVLPDGRIILDLAMNKDTRGQSVALEDQQTFAIDTKSVTTRVLLQDGETGVIGGLFTQRQIDDSTRVPMLHRLPLLGWLFRSKSKGDTRSELLIFLTPKIQRY